MFFKSKRSGRVVKNVICGANGGYKICEITYQKRHRTKTNRARMTFEFNLKIKLVATSNFGKVPNCTLRRCFIAYWKSHHWLGKRDQTNVANDVFVSTIHRSYPCEGSSTGLSPGTDFLHLLIAWETSKISSTHEPHSAYNTSHRYLV